uniref:Uncharacterized protein n=1 Tax=viral metagenome TaxID=1070528 RepID=A0A6M3JBT3_9ZZZZ
MARYNNIGYTYKPMNPADRVKAAVKVGKKVGTAYDNLTDVQQAKIKKAAQTGAKTWTGMSRTQKNTALGVAKKNIQRGTKALRTYGNTTGHKFKAGSARTWTK